MKLYKYVLVILAAVILLSGCGPKNDASSDNAENKTNYYIIKDSKKTYFSDYQSMDSLNNYRSEIDKTISAFNEIKDGKRDLSYIDKVASKDLKNSEQYKTFLKSVPGENELKCIGSDIVNSQIEGAVYDKDTDTLKIYAYIERSEKQKDSGQTLSVFDNQTYIYKVDGNNLTLIKYDLSQHIE